MAIKIERGFKLPASRGKYRKYPFGEMKKGDSFLIESDDDIAGVRQAGCHYGRRSGTGIKFSILKTDAGHRCWRIA